MTKVYYTIYQITNLINGKIYVGKHKTTNPHDMYYGSGKLIQNAIIKYGKENFKKQILFIFDTENKMNQKEKELITEDFIKKDDNYNLGIGGEGGPHFKGRKKSKEHQAKLQTPEVKKKRAETLRLKRLSGELTAWNKGRKRTLEEKEIIAASKRGKKLSHETKMKISASLKGRGHKHSEETKEKMRNSRQRYLKNNGLVD